MRQNLKPNPIFVEELDFNNALDRWSKAVREQIERHSNAGKTIYVIALSRKMPRLLNWLKTTLPTIQVKKLFEALDSDKVKITTEYAIPIIWGNNNKGDGKIEGIVIDDVLITGNTANRACIQWMAFTKNLPLFYTIFRKDGENLHQIFESSDSLSMPRLDNNELTSALSCIAERIMSKSLPMDTEYPLVHFNLDYNTVKKHIQDSNIKKWINYDVVHLFDKSQESFTLILEDERDLRHNNDFSKIRLFPKDNHCWMEVIAPNAISTVEAINPNYFTDSDYKAIWQQSLSTIFGIDTTDKENGDEDNSSMLRLNRINAQFYTTIVIINYLLSLSCFFRHYNILVSDNAEINIKSDDLELLFGSEFTNLIYKSLLEIISKRKISPAEHPRVALPTYVNPPKERGEYLNLIANVMDPAGSIEENLEAIFKVSHFDSPLTERILKVNKTGHNNFGETYDSLNNYLSLYSKDSDIEKRVNKWVDERIDENKIAPKYEMVLGSDSNLYFKRFFMCGSNRF